MFYLVLTVFFLLVVPFSDFSFLNVFIVLMKGVLVLEDGMCHLLATLLVFGTSNDQYRVSELILAQCCRIAPGKKILLKYSDPSLGKLMCYYLIMFVCYSWTQQKLVCNLQVYFAEKTF